MAKVANVRHIGTSSPMTASICRVGCRSVQQATLLLIAERSELHPAVMP